MWCLLERRYCKRLRRSVTVYSSVSREDTTRPQPSDDRSRLGASLADLALDVEEKVRCGGRTEFRFGGEEVFELFVGDGLDEFVVAGEPRGAARTWNAAILGGAACGRRPGSVEQAQEGGRVGVGVAGACARALRLLTGAGAAATVPRVRHVVPACQSLPQVHDHRP